MKETSEPTKEMVCLCYEGVGTISFRSKRRELLARTIADFTKAIFAVAVASQFFKEFEPNIRILLGMMIIIGVVAALTVQPEEKDHD